MRAIKQTVTLPQETTGKSRQRRREDFCAFQIYYAGTINNNNNNNNNNNKNKSKKKNQHQKKTEIKAIFPKLPQHLIMFIYWVSEMCLKILTKQKPVECQDICIEILPCCYNLVFKEKVHH